MSVRKKTVYIVVHTAAVLGDTTAKVINLSHRARGFEQIGYHWVIRKNGQLEKGRAEYLIGAHCRGLNFSSVGICITGHGDYEAWTPQQKNTLFKKCNQLYDVYPYTSISRTIGHHEINKLVNTGVLKSEFYTNKTCPGKLIDMDAVRRELMQYRYQYAKKLAID